MFLRYCACLGVLALGLAVTGCKSVGDYNLPPAEHLMHPGPGVAGPGPGVMVPPAPPAVYDDGQAAEESSASYGTAQILFVGPESLHVQWDVGDEGAFDSVPLITPGRQNFSQGGIYRLKLTHVPGRAGVELYPTLEVGYTTPRSKAFLTHNAIPIQFTEEDFDQVISNNFVTKVIYLPDPDFQDLALAGVETLVSTRLDPGVDPIVEADRRGAILSIVRMGNVDLEMPEMEQHSDQNIIQASQLTPVRHHVSMGGGTWGGPAPVQPAPATPGYVSGVTSPSYGMPMSGTPIGLPGPAHIPLGIPAGLQKHRMVNHTRMRIPGPSQSINIDMKHKPGMSYPIPATDVRVRETMVTPTPHVNQPLFHKLRRVR